MTTAAIHFVAAQVPVTRSAYTYLAETVLEGSPDVPATEMNADVEELCFYGLIKLVADRYEVTAEGWKVLRDAQDAEAYAAIATKQGLKPLKAVGHNPVNSVVGYFSENMIMQATRCEYSTMSRMMKGEQPTCSKTRLARLQKCGYIARQGRGFRVTYTLTTLAVDKMVRAEARWYAAQLEEHAKTH